MERRRNSLETDTLVCARLQGPGDTCGKSSCNCVIVFMRTSNALLAVCTVGLAVAAEVVGQLGRVASGGFGRIDDAMRSVVPRG